MIEATFTAEWITSTPPEGCNLKVGDVVTYTNDYGVVFRWRRVIGFAKDPRFGRTVHFSGGAYWAPVRPESLKLETAEAP